MMRTMVCLAAWAVLGLVAGCGGGTASRAVSGSVTFDGTAVAEGDIVFRPADAQQQPVAGKIQGGNYTLDCPPGQYKVEITAMRATDKPDGVGGYVNEPYIPAQYNTATTLEAKVEASGDTQFNFDLKSAG